jgi:hypothetical protein
MRDSSTFRVTTVALLLTVLFPPATAFGARRRAVAPRLDVETLSIVFVVRSGGTRGTDSLDLGNISVQKQPRTRRPGWLTTRQLVGVRIERSSAASGAGTATLRAWLPVSDARSAIRVAGVQLSAVPQVIDARHRIGSTATYVIEVDVKETADEGTILNGIEWDVTEN